MDQREFINKIDQILENSKTGILTTVDAKGRPYSRWMTPVVLKSVGPAVFAFSIPGAKKIEHIRKNPEVQWLIQTKDLREIVTINGRAEIVDNPSVKSDLLEVLGPRLTMFYKVNENSQEWVILETRIEEGTYFRPISGIRETTDFS